MRARPGETQPVLLTGKPTGVRDTDRSLLDPDGSPRRTTNAAPSLFQKGGSFEAWIRPLNAVGALPKVPRLLH